MKISESYGKVGTVKGIDCCVISIDDYFNNIDIYNGVYAIIKTGRDNGIYDMVLNDVVVGTVVESGNITWASGNNKVRFSKKTKKFSFAKEEEKKEKEAVVVEEEINLDKLLAIGDKMFKDMVKEIDKIVGA